jgi:hypothetical protein
MEIPDQVWDAYGLNKAEIQIIRFGNGLINQTWKLEHGPNAYILQTINQQVFQDPTAIASNINL